MTILNQENALQLAELQNVIPPLTDIGTGMRERMADAVPWYDGLRCSVGWPPSIDSALLTSILSENIRMTFTQELSPQLALLQSEHEWNVILQDWWAARDGQR